MKTLIFPHAEHSPIAPEVDIADCPRMMQAASGRGAPSVVVDERFTEPIDEATEGAARVSIDNISPAACEKITQAVSKGRKKDMVNALIEGGVVTCTAASIRKRDKEPLLIDQLSKETKEQLEAFLADNDVPPKKLHRFLTLMRAKKKYETMR